MSSSTNNIEAINSAIIDNANSNVNSTNQVQPIEVDNQKVKILKEVINDGGRHTIATLTAEVEEKLLKTNNPLRDNKITKLVNYTVALNDSYQNAVNNQRDREGKTGEAYETFTSGSSWHTPVYDGKNGSLVTNKNDNSKFYLKFICKSAEVVNYFIDGKVADENQVMLIKQFKSKSSDSNKKQGLDNPVILRVLNVENLKTIKTNGVLINF